MLKITALPLCSIVTLSAFTESSGSKRNVRIINILSGGKVVGSSSSSLYECKYVFGKIVRNN